MATFLNFTFAFVFVSLIIGQGYCQPCTLANISISQSKTGKMVQNKPEWAVTISNGCVCSQKDLQVSCDGFQTVEVVDPSILAKSGGACLVDNGNSVTTFTFNYAWDTPFPFKPIQSTINCS